MLDFAKIEDGHGVRILNARGLHRDAVRNLRAAQDLIEKASDTRVSSLRSRLIGQAIAQHKAACRELVQEASCADLEP